MPANCKARSVCSPLGTLLCGLGDQHCWKWLVITGMTLRPWVCRDAGRAGCLSPSGSGMQDPRDAGPEGCRNPRDAGPQGMEDLQDAGPAGLSACPPALYPIRTKPSTRARDDMGRGGGRVGRREGAGHKRARVRHPVGAGTSSVATVGGGPPGEGWELLQYANVPWELNHHQVLLKGRQRAVEGPRREGGERRGRAHSPSVSPAGTSCWAPGS